MKCGDCSSGYVNDGAKGCKGLCLGVDEWVCWGACSSLFSLNNIAVISFRHAMPFSIVVVKHSAHTNIHLQPNQKRYTFMRVFSPSLTKF